MKNWVIFIIGMIFSSSMVLAISSDLKDSYEKGETIIAEVSGIILEPIIKEQVEFRRGHVLVPFNFDFKKLGDKWYVWAIAPELENNYTFVIKNIVTSESGKTVKTDFEKNFSIKGNLTDYSINPGFVYTKEEFSVEVELNEDFDKSISVDFPSKKDVILKPGKNRIYFSIEEINKSSFVIVNIGKYKFPAYIVPIIENNDSKIGRNDTNTSETIYDINLEINPEIISSTILAGRQASYPFQIINLGKGNVSDIFMEYNKDFFFIENIENLTIKSLTLVELNLSFTGKVDDKMKKNGLNDFILIKIGNYSIKLPVVINFTEDVKKVETPYLRNYTKLKYCSELGGISCSAGEICDGKTQISVDDTSCCLSRICKKPESDGGGNSWIGWLIAAVILIILGFVFLRYKKTQGEKDPLKKKIAGAESKFSKGLPVFL